MNTVQKILMTKKYQPPTQRTHNISGRPGHVDVKLDDKWWIRATARETDTTDERGRRQPVAVTVLLGMFMVLPIGMLSVGVKYLSECPKEPRIPIYLLVGGCFGLLKLLSMLWKQVRSRRYESLDEFYDTDEDHGAVFMSQSSRFTDVVLSIFLLIWFAFGNYWVYSIWMPSFDQMLNDPSNWCDKRVYMFAFVQICITNGLVGLIGCLFFIITICQRMKGDKS